MKEIIQQWCKTNQLTLEQANQIIIEFCRLFCEKIPNAEQLQRIMMLHQSFCPIDFEYLIGRICDKNEWQLMSVQSKPDPFGNRQTIYRILY